MIGLQALAIKASTDSKYRGDAAYLANQLLSQMWADDHSTLAVQYQTATDATGVCAGGTTAANTTKVYAWLTLVQNQFGQNASGIVNTSIAPTSRQQVVVVDNPPIPPQTSHTYQVTITLCWRQPQDAAGQYHNYVVTGLINS